MYVDTLGQSMLDEGPMSEFLDQQMALESKPIIDYCYTSASIYQVMDWSGSRIS